jgi:3-deoxy-D-manno-octulosonic-acid transferase
MADARARVGVRDPCASVARASVARADVRARGVTGDSDARAAGAVVRFRGAAAVELTVYRVAGMLARIVVILLRAGAAAESVRWVSLGERLGRWVPRPDRPASDERATVWIHAASVGEVMVAGPLVAALRAQWPELRLVVTSNTATGRRVAETLGVDEARFLPIDEPRAVAGALESARPDLFVFVETEIWPVLLAELAKRGTPCAMVNARISDRSFPRYRLVASLMRAVLSYVAVACVRDRASYERLVALGVRRERTILAGDLKLDALDAREVERTPDLLADLRGGHPVLLAASTHEGEDEVVLEAFGRVKHRHRTARLVVAPRHPERAAAVEALAVRAGFVASRWTRFDAASAWDVLVVDTTGELRGFMPSATGAFVGGSLVDAGGHNVVEPAAFALPVAVGPYLDNVREPAGAMAETGCLRVVHDAAELAGLWGSWLDDAEAARESGRRGRAFVDAHRGALARTLEALVPWLPAADGAGSGAGSPRRHTGESGRGR